MSPSRLWPAALLLACTFDPSGLGEVPSSLSDPSGADGSTSSTGSTGSTSIPVTTGAPPDTTDSTAGITGSASGDPTTGTIEPGSTTEIDEMTTSTSTSTTSTTSTTQPDTTTTTTTTTGPPGPCDGNPPIKIIELVADAAVVAPMFKTMSNQGEGQVAVSEVAEQGTVTFNFELECGGEFAVWGRVLDAESGVNDYDPDSFYLSANANPEVGWFYGCQTFDLPNGYHWLRVRAGVQGTGCDEPTPWTLSLGAGPHSIRMRNREKIDGSGYVAAVARILLTNIPNYTPALPD